MAAVIKSWRSSHSYNLCTVRCKADFQLTGRRPTTKGDLEFDVTDSEYADDTVFTFESREDCERITPQIVKHFTRWGLEVHVGAENRSSKSEILFCAKDPRCYTNPRTYDDTNLSPVCWEGGLHIAVVDKFKYLGSYLTRNCKDDYDVDNRIISAGRAFGALRKCIFSTYSISSSAKRAVYTSAILSILLYGCECWSLTKKLLNRLRVFHNQCIRTMCRVTLKHTWDHHISSAELRQRIGLHPIDFYIYSRQLCWLGKVSRMDLTRLPRRMLTCWVPHKRPIGRPRFTYGETIKKALKKFGLDGYIDIPWHALAAKRSVWSSLLSPSNFYQGISRSDATSALKRSQTHRTSTSTNTSASRHRLPREPAEYVTVPCMDINDQCLIVAKAWVRGKSTSQGYMFLSQVNLDMSGEFGFRTFGNPQAQKWFSDAIEAHLLGNPHPALIHVHSTNNPAKCSGTVPVPVLEMDRRLLSKD